MAKFKPGDRVILKANKAEGWPREAGKVLEQIDPISYLVEVDRKYRTGDYDDGLRDGVPSSSMIAMKKEKKKRRTKKKKRTPRRSRRRR